MRIPSKYRLGILSKLNYKNVFFIEYKLLKSAKVRKPSTGWIKKVATIATVAAFSITATINSLLPDYILKPSVTALNLAKETRLDNEVIVYGDT